MGRSQDPVLSVRLPGDLEKRLNDAAAKLDLSKNDIARHAIRAAVAAIEANDFRITLPLQMQVDGPVKSTPQEELHTSEIPPKSEALSSTEGLAMPASTSPDPIYYRRGSEGLGKKRRGKKPTPAK